MEIKFKGKEIDSSEWAYGGIIHQADCYGDKYDKYFIIDDGRNAHDCSFVQNNGVDHLKGVKVIGNICYDFNGEEINVIEETYRTFYYI